MSAAESNPPDAANASASAVPPTDDLAAQLAQAIRERDAAQDQLLRVRAEFDNIRRRQLREQDEERRYASGPLLRALLPALDGLDRALKAASNASPEDLLKGVQMVAQQFEAGLSAQSIQAISSVGQPFDPNRHEAIVQQPSAEHPPQTVLMEVERGYLLHERVVRPSKVVVSIAPPSAES